MIRSVRSRRVCLPGEDEPCDAVVHVREGRIVRIDRGGRDAELDLGDDALLPGAVDTHAHINEPGRTDWEGFRTATRAAAAGGITTVIDMPLNSIPATTTREALAEKTASAGRSGCWIDTGFWGGVVPGNAAELEPMIGAGVFGFKAFLIDSGVDEFPMSDEAVLREAMPVLARQGVPLLVHAELELPLRDAPAGAVNEYPAFLASRPPEWEVEAIRMMIRLSGETGCPVHIVHLSAADALGDLAEAKARGVRITAETCPHYLSFTAEEVPRGRTEFKCAPPIRGRENRERLWRALEDGVIDFVVSDHSPCSPALKLREKGDFEKAWGGISGLQFSLPAVWTGMRERGIPLGRLAEWTARRTAAFAGLEGRKGVIAEGADADFMVFDPGAPVTPGEAPIHHRHGLTPYAESRLHGRVKATFLRGGRIYGGGGFGDAPAGKLIERRWK